MFDEEVFEYYGIDCSFLFEGSVIVSMMLNFFEENCGFVFVILLVFGCGVIVNFLLVEVLWCWSYEWCIFCDNEKWY